MTSIHLLDTVALARDLPQFGLAAGEVGAVVEVLGGGEAFEVEFCDRQGRTYALHALHARDLIALHTRGEPLRTQPLAA